jgi:hypothetical protein
MLHIAAKENVPIRISRVVKWVPEVVFAILHATLLETVDVLPCLRVCESEVVGRDADDCAVFAVQYCDVVG